MRKLLRTALLIILVAITAKSLSQESTSDSYQLQVPTANDYLTLIHGLLAHDSIDAQAVQAVAQEIEAFNYLGNGIPYNELTEVYYSLDAELEFRLNHNYWVRAIMEAWLNTHPDELETNETLSFDDFSVDIQAVDFLNDGQAEYILEIYRGRNLDDIYSTATYDAYMIAYIGANGEYHVAVTPYPMHYNLAWMTWQRDSWQTVRLEDINADGKIEWVVYGYGYNTGPGAQARGRVLILVWNGTQLINIAPESLGFNNNGLEDVGWNYENTDADNAIEIVETTQHYNSWGCSFQTQARYDWNIEQATYLLTHEESIYPETVGCVVTDAETAMWNEDFPTAISFYEDAITLANESDYPAGWFEEEIEQFQYIQARYALALALNGQAEEALQQLRTLKSITPASDGIADIIELMVETYEVDQDSIKLCTALYNYFIPYDIDYNYGYSSPLTVYVGFTLVDNEMFIMNAYTPATRNAACDIDWLIVSRLDEAIFVVDTLPADTFESEGIAVRATRHFDINQDGIEDWLVWVDAKLIPFAFISDSNMGIYHLSRPNLPTSVEQSSFTLFNLPQNSGTALAWLSFDETRDPYMGFCQNQQDIGVLTLWKLNDEFELQSFFGQAVCEQRTWDQLIQNDGRELHLWTPDALEPGGLLIDAIYSWDTATSHYVLIQPPPEYWEAMRLEAYGEESNLTTEINIATGNLRNALLTSEAVEVNLTALEEKLAGDLSQVDPMLIQRASYYEALAFEALGHSDQALTTYIAIYESAADTVWGSLAALHLIIVN